ncbi:MAG: ribosomal protein S18-alanine N-acetyltransferase [Clostridia bacterium]|nr:ribosomal protein S18-alanine N-acetyltransferase [Clostridia bacterium]
MEKNNILIRFMNLQDLQYLKQHLSIQFDDFWTFSILEKEFNGENTTYIVAEENNEILGFAGILTIIDESNIMNIVTKKDKRHMGVGSLLLSELIKISKKLNMKSITLEVNENNTPAIKLYKKYNFEQIGVRKKYYDNTDSAILMTLYL